MKKTYKNLHGKHPLNRDFRLKLRKVRYLKCRKNVLLSPKNLSFSSICQARGRMGTLWVAEQT